MTTQSSIRSWFDRNGRLLRLRLDRPKANVLDAAMTSALLGAIEAHRDQADLRGILIDASGPHFSFGASVEEHLPGRCAEMLAGFHALVRAIVACEVPVLVAVRGQCLGGGLEVATAAHLVFVAPDARLGQPEIALGVFAPAASCLLPERLSLAAAEDLLLSGRTVTGSEAGDMGLATAVADDPEGAALAYFDAHLAPRSASSLRYAVRAARQGLVERVDAKLASLEALYLEGLMETADAVEGLDAFIAKRQAVWKDR